MEVAKLQEGFKDRVQAEISLKNTHMAPTARIRTRDCHIHVESIFWFGDSDYPPPPAPPAMPNHLLKVDLASESERLAGADGCIFLCGIYGLGLDDGGWC